MEQLWLKLQHLFGMATEVHWLDGLKITVEVFVIGYAAVWTWRRIRGTQAERLFRGVVFLASLCVMSWLLDLTLITSILQHLIPLAVIGLIVVFQPEIRRGLSYLGRTTFRIDLTLTDSQKVRTSETIKQIIAAVKDLSKERTGALIVIEPPEGERDYLSPGTTINAEISSNLLLSIFVQKSPLHDGAVIIRGSKLIAAGVILPITDNPKLSYRYGTRHRAALGLSELYDGLCIVVSEETGAISAANRGMLVRYRSAEELLDPLSYFYEHGSVEAKSDSPLQSFLSMFGSGKLEATELSEKKEDEVKEASFSPVDLDREEETFVQDRPSDGDIRPQTTGDPVT